MDDAKRKAEFEALIKRLELEPQQLAAELTIALARMTPEGRQEVRQWIADRTPHPGSEEAAS